MQTRPHGGLQPGLPRHRRSRRRRLRQPRDNAYAFGHELRGLSPCGRRAVESGRVKVASETSNAGYQRRLLAAAMGVPFMPITSLLGTSTLEQSSAKVIRHLERQSDLPGPRLLPRRVAVPRSALRQVWDWQFDCILADDFEFARHAAADYDHGGDRR